MSDETPALPRPSRTPTELACASTFFTQDDMVTDQPSTAASFGSEQLTRSYESGRPVCSAAAYPRAEPVRNPRNEDARPHPSPGARSSRHEDQCGICHDSAADIIQAATTSGLFAQHAIWKCTHEHCDKFFCLLCALKWANTQLAQDLDPSCPMCTLPLDLDRLRVQARANGPTTSHFLIQRPNPQLSPPAARLMRVAVRLMAVFRAESFFNDVLGAGHHYALAVWRRYFVEKIYAHLTMEQRAARPDLIIRAQAVAHTAYRNIVMALPPDELVAGRHVARPKALDRTAYRIEGMSAEAQTRVLEVWLSEPGGRPGGGELQRQIHGERERPEIRYTGPNAPAPPQFGRPWGYIPGADTHQHGLRQPNVGYSHITRTLQAGEGNDPRLPAGTAVPPTYPPVERPWWTFPPADPYGVNATNATRTHAIPAGSTSVDALRARNSAHHAQRGREEVYVLVRDGQPPERCVVVRVSYPLRAAGRNGATRPRAAEPHYADAPPLPPLYTPSFGDWDSGYQPAYPGANNGLHTPFVPFVNAPPPPPYASLNFWDRPPAAVPPSGRQENGSDGFIRPPPPTWAHSATPSHLSQLGVAVGSSTGFTGHNGPDRTDRLNPPHIDSTGPSESGGSDALPAMARGTKRPRSRTNASPSWPEPDSLFARTPIGIPTPYSDHDARMDEREGRN